MPPRVTSSAGRGRGAPHRGGPPGGATSIRGGAGVSGASGLQGNHVVTVGVKRPSFGTSGQPIAVAANFFEVSLPQGNIHHYDVITPSEKTLPARLNMDLVEHLQTVHAPEVFTPRAVYDGRKNMFAPRELPLGQEGSREFSVSLTGGTTHGSSSEAPTGRGPKVYKIRLTKVNTINPEVLERFIAGQQSHDNTVLTALTALNVVIRMEPVMKYPFNVRSFFTDRETKDIGAGLVLWRGYFQSIRPAISKLLVNVDISTGTMYKPGALLNLCLEYLNHGKHPSQMIQPQHINMREGLGERDRIKLQRFISGIRIQTTYAGEHGRKTPRVLKKLSSAGASDLTFALRDGNQLTVANYFRQLLNRPLKFPGGLCAEVGQGALIPLELCTVPPGQIMRKQVPPEKTKDVLEFATKRPADRLASISNGLSVLSYGQSDYVRQFGMVVEDTAGPIKLNARVLRPPNLKYGTNSRQPTITPREGAWNMVDKRFHRPSVIDKWAVVIYERQTRFNEQAARDMVRDLVKSCQDVGIQVHDQNPIIQWQNAQGHVADQLRRVGQLCRQQKGKPPQLIVVILPDGGNDIYTAVKHFGDITVGVATQCMKSSRCYRAKPQYFANICLKMNVKLGGINTISDPQSGITTLSDPRSPTIVMGADVIHPPPGSDGRPSFTALVGSVDSDSAKYVATSRVQASRVELIEDLQDMAKHILVKYMQYRQVVEKKTTGIAPTRLYFYRDGVSEGQFQQVLDSELKALKEACRELKIQPKITIIIVAKRHHTRFFPTNPKDADRSGNCPAGTVVDQDIVHPAEWDWYLLSHGGLLGTSRPAHYNVLYDENNSTPDGLQTLSFALCHLYARSTRSVSIPAPVYYADIVCSRAKNHYDPQGSLDFSDTVTQTDSNQAQGMLETYKQNFRPLHPNMERLMYFS
ncbi:argonaute-like protein [Coniophora puteana RWD-64-598 SS2]|uniref:Argonaute-like protein n=1 Tax=Coniophora puteana (strain RWD-64-598) TaxID=741705 RepID=A0A5M3MSH7_CONPW|nr:argonaute-like protein [Coniophora puteana RWD-64-598 SS2]EIW82123.1 argonaute-like protein [Coniophora puteana RWD-64-598 SS2]